MKKGARSWFIGKSMNRLVLITLAILTLFCSFYFASPTFSKYVLDTVYYNVMYHSAEIYPLQSIGTISGTIGVGQTLTAGTLVPSDATVAYQWQKCAVAEGPYTDISGADSGTYTLSAEDYSFYIRVIAAGTGKYTGTAASAAAGPVAKAPLTAISDIIGTTSVGQTLTAGTVTPIGATVTYQWQRSSNGITYSNISEATSGTYTLKGSDINYYIKVTVTGTGAYTGTITSTSTTDKVISGGTTPITAIGVLGGICQVEQTLTAGELAPSGATATYEWQRCTTEDGVYENIAGAVSSWYTLKAGDLGDYIRVNATGSGNYTGTATSASKGPVTHAHLTDISAINGTTKVGQALTAGSLTPGNATASYQWQRSATVYGTYTDISGATSSTYLLTSEDSGCYIKVSATGTGSYTGMITSTNVGPIQDQTTSVAPIESIGAIGGTAQVGSALTAGELSPSGATVTYQWQKCSAADGTYLDISGATLSSYMLSVDDYNDYIRVKATGSGSFTGTATSTYAGPVTACPITAIGAISGSTVPGQELTAGTVIPLGATVTYQWQRSDTGSGGTYTNISGAMSSTYTVSGSDSYRYIRVIAAGTGAYSGTVTSAPTAGRVSYSSTAISDIGAITGFAQVGNTLAAGTLSPSGATATYQWKKCTTEDGIYESIPGATSNSYKLSADDYNYYIKVTATGSGSYTGTVTGAVRGPVAKASITAIGVTGGTVTPGQTLTAGTIIPLGATVSYQWQRSATAYGTYTDISGAIFSTYSLGESDIGYYLRVKATGTGSYTGTVTGVYAGPVFGGSATLLTAIAEINGTVQVGQTLTTGELSPSGVTATYRWQKCTATDGVYTDITGATSSSYTLSADDYNYYIRVKATGSGSCSGTVTSMAAGPVAAAPITAISNIIGTTYPGQTLAAGTVTPLGATVAYQWQRSDTGSGSTFTNMSGATSNFYTVSGSDSYRYFRVIVTGTGAYTGTVASAPTTSRVSYSLTSITDIGEITGVAQIGSTLTVGTLTPTGATATYQWQRTADGNIFENISGATSGSYTTAADDLGFYIVVAATGSGEYSGTVTSAATGPVAANPLSAIGTIDGTTAFGQTLTAGQLIPSGATAAFQWQRCAAADGTYEIIADATSSTYILGEDDIDNYIKVEATGTGYYSGTVISAYVGPIVETAVVITNIGEVTGTAQVGETLTVGELTPSDATVTYQWQKCVTADGEYTDIAGADSSTYILSVDDYGYYIRVKATGSDGYTGTVTSTNTSPTEAAPIDISEIMGVTIPVFGETPDTTVTETAQYTATISWSSSDTKFKNNVSYTAIITITAKTGYTLTGVSQDFFTVAGATTVTNSADSGVITAIFPEI